MSPQDLTTPNKTHTVSSSSHTYSYIHHPPTHPDKPILLFLHGFPSTSHDWRYQIAHFHALGYGILAPDLLGYGASSKPLDPSEYVGSIMSADIISILDYEGLEEEKVVGIAHDWGTYLLTQIVVYYPERLSKVVYFSVPFTRPGRKSDIPELNKKTKKALGYEMYGYWIFFVSEGAGKTLGDNWSQFFDLTYAANPQKWKTSFASLNALETHIKSSTPIPTGSYITPSDKSHHHAAFKYDYSAPVTWYKRAINNLGVDSEIQSLKEGKIKDRIPGGIESLMITGTKDAVCLADWAEAAMKGLTEKGRLRVEHLEAGHWIMLERRAEVNRVLEEFLSSEKQESSKL